MQRKKICATQKGQNFMLTATVPAKGQLTTITISKVDALPLNVLFFAGLGLGL